jgi:hypothetical protein
LAGVPPASAEPASGAGATASSAAAPRQQLSVPRPTDAAAQIEDLLRQQDVAYTLSINADVMSIDADVPDAKRAKLVEPLRKFRLELPADGKLRVRITPAR